MNDTQKLLYGVKDAAHALSLSRGSIYGMIRDGTLPPPAKHGSRSLWPAADIEQAAQRIANGAGKR